MGGEDDGDGEDDEEEVRGHVGDAHGDELHEGLPALGAGVGDDLPVVRYGVAFGEVGDEDSDEGGGEVVVDQL